MPRLFFCNCRYLFKRRNLRPVVSDIAEKERQGELQQEMQNEQQTSGDGDAGQQELPQHSHDPTEVTKEKDSAKGFKCLLLDPSIGPGRRVGSSKDGRGDATPLAFRICCSCSWTGGCLYYAIPAYVASRVHCLCVSRAGWAAGGLAESSEGCGD